MNELKSLGWQIIDPVIKTLACNVVGMGAMAHVEDIVSYINNIAEKSEKKSLLRNDAFDKPSSSSSASSSSASVITSVDVPRVTAFRKENDRKSHVDMKAFIKLTGKGIIVVPIALYLVWHFMRIAWPILENWLYMCYMKLS